MEIDAGSWVGISQILAQYGHLVDDKAWDRMGEVFSEDVVLDYTDVGNSVMEGLTEVSSGFAAMTHPFGHHLTNAYVVAISDGGSRYKVRSKWIVAGRQGEARSGDYLDEFALREKEWRIVKRVATRRATATKGS